MSDDYAALESLVAGYDGDTSSADLAKFAKAVQPAVDFVNEVRAEKQRERNDSDMNDIVKFFSEEEKLKEFPEELKHAFLQGHAQEDPDFVTAFDNRTKNPKAWQAAQGKARDELTKIASNLPGSKGQTAASGDRVSPEKLMKMSEHEWREYKEKQEELAEAAVAR